MSVEAVEVVVALFGCAGELAGVFVGVELCLVDAAAGDGGARWRLCVLSKSLLVLLVAVLFVVVDYRLFCCCCC